ncbi:HDIG domain-containing metalloprotein [Anaerocellum danielii]|uniref:HDIG domain-containing protein n=1 Tax=Anaerocellum danielii TaxID=1387557 RepID=A0ABZ0TY65_9FIRM|nr:HDIG domain-containing metalloprotein [Caldicellulosiruptor danielii]WPX08350.1 HDIG domain-containing protein [Caldicellulosiruptor danielii]
MNITREVALEEIKKRIKTQNLLKHCLACEAIMRDLACYFEQDMDKWGICGLVHDIDYEDTKNDPGAHSLVGAKILEDLGFDKDIVYAVKVHNDRHGLPRLSLLDKALYCVDPTSGFIVAGALILPSKKLSDVTVPFLLNRFNEKSFAKGANREQMKACSELGLELEEFFRISLSAMQKISNELGL